MKYDTFKEFVLDQLSALPELRAKAMFGGHGLYAGEHFFAILFAGRLYFKVGPSNRARYLKRGMSPFTYEKEGRTLTMNYHEVPPEVLEDRTDLQQWANDSLTCATPKSLVRSKRNRDG